jgi:hypothetical protein
MRETKRPLRGRGAPARGCADAGEDECEYPQWGTRWQKTMRRSHWSGPDGPDRYRRLPLADRSHVRCTGPARSRRRRPPARRSPPVLLSHHQHLDNLDRAGRAFLAKAGATFTTAAGAQRLGKSATGLAGDTLAGANGRRLLISATPARHGPVGIEPITGDVVGFLIGREASGDAIYVTGDTVWYGRPRRPAVIRQSSSPCLRSRPSRVLSHDDEHQ